MATMISRLTSRYGSLIERHRNRDFLDAAMAASALVAIADGDASLEEGQRVGELLRTLAPLAVFDPARGLDIYMRHVADIRQGDAGRARAQASVAAAAKDGETAALVVLICLAVSEADGIVVDEEVAAIERISDLLGVDANHVSMVRASMENDENSMESRS